MLSTEMIEKLQADVKTATSPEEAAKRFHTLISEILAKDIGDALVMATSKISSAIGTADAISGWEKFITGCNMRFDWPTPPGTPIRYGAPIFYSTSQAPNAKLQGASVSIGISFGC